MRPLWIAIAALTSVAVGGPVEIHFTARTDAFRNPGQGWSVADASRWDELEAVVNAGAGYRRYDWKTLEPKEGQYAWEVIDRDLEFYARKGLPFGFRIMCANYHSDGRDCTPQWVFDKGAAYTVYLGQEYALPDGTRSRDKVAPHFDDPVFLSCHRRFLEALAKRYDGDSRLSGVDLGSYGNWGEWHCWELWPKGTDAKQMPHYSEEVRRQYVDVYLQNFKRTPLMFLAGDPEMLAYAAGKGMFRVGLRRDGVGDPNLEWCSTPKYAVAYPEMSDVWKHRPVWFEWWAKCTDFGKKGTWLEGWTIPGPIDWMLTNHVSLVNTTPFDPALCAKALPKIYPDLGKIDLYAGARLVARSAKVSRSGTELAVEIEGTNEGASRIHLPYSAEYILADAAGRTVCRMSSRLDPTSLVPGRFHWSEKLVLPSGKTEGRLRLRLKHSAGKLMDFRWAVKETDASGALDLGPIPQKADEDGGAFAWWNADPLAWTVKDGSLQCRNSGFALCETEPGRKVTVSARVTPQSCANAGWATLGVAISADRWNFWHLALVKEPEANGSHHSFEIGMMLDGAWPVQDGIKCLENRTGGNWEFGRDYDVTLKMDRSGVRGEIVEVGSGKRIYSATYAFNGKSVDCGRPALHVMGGLKGAFTRMEQSVGDVVAAPRVPAYPSDSAKRAVAKPTGFIHVEKRDGRWTAIDPNGAPFTVLGVNHVHPAGMFCESLGYSPYGRYVREHYPDCGAWADETLSRLRSWGFTALGACCDFERLGHRGLTHTIILNMGDRLCYGNGEWWIRKSINAPCTAFPNVFHTDFARACDWVAAEKCAKAKDDPWLLGYFIDNELAWWGNGGLAEGMFDTVNALSAEHTAKKALEGFLAGRPATPELKTEFLALVADRYFSITTAAIRRHDPNHMVLGCRFAGLGGAHDVVWKAAAKYCDIVTFNCYPWADLDRNVVLDRKDGVPVREKFDELYAKVSRPMLITEWSFPALDAGRPCYYGAGQRFRTQDLRVRATALFARTLLTLPYFIGYDYFMWVDMPAPGVNRSSGEDCNYGLVREDGRPYEGVTSMFAQLQKDIGRVRRAGFPKAREYTPPPAVSEHEKFVSEAKGASDAVRFRRDGNGWTLANDAGLALMGSVGGEKDMASDVILDGRRFGSLGGLVEMRNGEDRLWIDAREVRDVRFVRDGVCGSVEVTAEGAHRNGRFALALRFTLAPGRKDFIGEILSVRNLGQNPMSVQQLYFRPFAAERPEAEVPRVPNLWKGPAESRWRFVDGATYEIVSYDQDAAAFRLWLNEGGGQHPDVAFAPPEPLTLDPGKEYRPPRPMSVRIVMTGGKR